MKVAPMGEVRNNFSRYLTKCRQEPVFVTRNGRIAAVLEYLEDKDLEDYLLERNRRFRAMLRRVRSEKGGMTLQDYRRSRGI